MEEMKNMRKIWKVMLVLGVGVLLTATAYAYNYTSNSTYANAVQPQQKAEDLLRSVEVKEVYSYKFNTTHYVLLKDGKMVGVIWKGSKDDVSIGTITPTRWGAKATLICNSEVVGRLFVDGKPVGWRSDSKVGSGHDGCGNGNGYRHGFKHEYA
ncbi:hypothetical protein DRP05_06790 [Archaeoglobales archaeon]|nr:MAG: hypothetical protein DRP05_06790 [Archaeoglobales archaeon]